MGKIEKMSMFAATADKINSGQHGWMASTDHELTYQIHEIFTKSYCNHTRETLFASDEELTPEEQEEFKKLPKEFDARTKWPKCKSIGHIRDQSECGACWAFGSVEAMTDRICIASNGEKNPILSAAHLSACDKKDGGCHGGLLTTAYDFYQQEGIVTGGDFNSNQGCWPFPYSCSGKDKTAESCPRVRGELPDIKCSDECPNKEYKDNKFADDKHFGQHHYPLKTEQKIMLDLYKNGPVTAGFRVYDDFFQYKHGVYEPAPDASMGGGHAVKILGWGEEDGKKYWLIANSWATGWGDQGFVKFKKGVCGIEQMVTSGLAKLK
jgi:cathepsin B